MLNNFTEKLKEVEENFNAVAEAITAKREALKNIEKEIYEKEQEIVFLRGKYEGLQEAMASCETADDNVVIEEVK